MKSFADLLVATGVVLALLGTSTAHAGVVGKAVGRAVKQAVKRGAAKALKKGAVRQKLGPVHKIRKPTVVERYTNHPATDKAKGLGGKGKHVFTRRPRVGRRGTAEHIQKELNIPHPVKQREKITLPPGTKYHERPIRGGRSSYS